MVVFGKKIIIGIVILVVIVAGYFFITGQTNTGLFAATANKNEIKVGTLVPLTGNLASIGNNVVMGMELAKTSLLKEKDTRVIEFVFEDSCYPKETIAGFSKMTDIDEIDLLNSFCIVGFVPVMPMTQEKEITSFSMAASPDVLLDQKFVFSLNKSIKQDANHLVMFASKELGAKTAAIIYYNTQLGADYEKHLKENFESIGGKIVFSGVTEVERTDFKSELAEIKSKNPDVIFIIQLANPLGLFLKQAREMGVSSIILSQSTAEDPKVLEAAKEASEGLIISSSQPKETTKEIENFNEKYFEKYGEHPNIMTAIAYDSTIIQIKAYETCAGEVECIQSEIKNVKNYSGASGVITINSEGSTNREPNFKIVKEGKFVLYEAS